MKQHISQASDKLLLEIMQVPAANHNQEVRSCKNILIFLPNAETNPNTDRRVVHAFNMAVIIAVLLDGNAFMRLVCTLHSLYRNHSQRASLYLKTV